jgi:hypothetical protein
MKRKYLLLIFLMLLSDLGFSQYSVENIPKDLLLNADAVIRNMDIRFSIKNPGQATYTVSIAVTILNQRGRYLGVMNLPYDKSSKAYFISGAVYNKNGILETKVTAKNIKDYTDFGGSLFNDNRVLYYEPALREYPYTVEYNYQWTEAGFLDIPDFIPLRNSGISLEKGTYLLDVPEGYEFKQIVKNIPGREDIAQKGSRVYYKWEVSHIKSIPPQAYSNHAFNYLPAVHLAPEEFVFERRKGSMKTWEDLSSWFYSLNSGRDELPETTKKIILDMVKDTDDEVEKARRLYEYMQSKTRYVSIQLGIGGWQPFEAKLVDEVGYGDCKALVNYTMALLNVAGIDSYYALVNSGKNARPVLQELSSDQFDHVILCLPLQNDTIWLECTNQQSPFGYIGDFTDNRYVLLVKENNGNLVKTKSYTKSDNFIKKEVEIIIDTEGNAEVSMKTEYSGLFSDTYFGVIRLGAQDQRKWIANYIDLPGFQLSDYSFEKDFGIIPRVSSNIKFSVKNYTSKTGKRIFLPLNQLSIFGSAPGKKPDFVRDIKLRNSFYQTDNFVFLIPGELKIEAIPDPVTLQSTFGEYSAQVEIIGNNVKYSRSLSINEGLFTADSYDELNDFFRRINLADQAKIVLINE